MSIILALIIFSLIILIHELGHFLLAKRGGIVVEEFSLGMGPRLISTVKGGTRYSLKLLPFGGSCMMLGEDENYQRLKNAKISAEKALQSVISQESWKQYLALDEICNELECARYKAMYLAGASDYEKLSK